MMQVTIKILCKKPTIWERDDKSGSYWTEGMDQQEEGKCRNR